jgi:outer membrane translocation and assembly module TamA
LINQGLSSQSLDYQAGIKQTWQQGEQSASSLTAGLTVYRLTDIISSVGQTVFQEPLGASIWGTANLDYYHRIGGQVWLKQQVYSALAIDLTLTDEQQNNLFKYTDWSLLAKNRLKRGNQRIRAGNLQSAKLSLSLDSRPEKLTRSRLFRDLQMPSPEPTVGWLGKLSVELARQSVIEIEESLRVSEFHLQLTRYNRFGKNHAFNIRGHAGMLTGADYLPQRLFYLGGFSLRGFAPREFIGDRLLLFNLEYVYLHPTGILGAIFSDSGCAWYQADQVLPRFGLSLGLGAGFSTPEGQLRFEVTMPQTGSSNGRQPHFVLRLGQAF